MHPEHAGLAPGTLAAVTAGVDRSAARSRPKAKLAVLQMAEGHHAWFAPSSIIGNYGTDYLFRAEVASLGLGANTAREAVYPTALTDSAGNPLAGSRTYRIVFRRGQLPPARAFWSLTMYDSNGFLAANPVHRYAIG